ncbi:MAG: hypothetical protein H6684_06305 [Deltaproteobacteria bacterium]|nr:hypothetical protein [Deltaproteobacteria bacterium]MCB9478592.1 hypothetical protein [Deltaproteobacteria bacterium]MCB9488324.1 hypothetical protein [Deltaproteobacteria bacterium]
MARKATYILLAVLCVATGLLAPRLLVQVPAQTRSQDVELFGEKQVHSNHIRLGADSGARVEWKSEDVAGANSVLISFAVEFEHLNKIALMAQTSSGPVDLLQNGDHYDTLTKRDGALEVGFVGGTAFVTRGAFPVTQFPTDVNNVESLTLQTENSTLRLYAVSAVRLDPKTEYSFDSRPLAYLEIASRKAGGRLSAIFIAVIALALIVEQLFAHLLLRLEPRKTTTSQIVTLAVVAGWLGLCAVSATATRLADFGVLMFIYGRVRYLVTASAAADPAAPHPIGRWVGIPVAALGALGVYRVLARAMDGGPAVIAMGVTAGVFASFFLLDAAASARQGRWGRAIAALGWSAIPAALTNLNVAYTPLAVLALGWPAWCVRRDWRWSGPVMLATGLLALASVEVAVRAAVPPEEALPGQITEDYAEEKTLFYVPRDFFEYTPLYMSSERMQVSAINLRSGPATFEKPEGTFRILVLGGSNVWGDGLESNDETFSAQMEKILNERYDHPRFEVLNGGVKGYIGFQIMLLYTLYAYRFDPDLVILYMNRNDFTTQRGVGRLRSFLEKEERLPISRETQLLLRKSRAYNLMSRQVAQWRESSWLLGRMEDKLLVDVNPPEDVQENMRTIVEKAKSQGAKVAIVSEFTAEEEQETRFFQVRKRTRELADEQHVPYFDAWTYMRSNYETWDVAFRHDPVHTTAYGHSELAKRLVKFLDDEKLLPALEKSP